MDCSQARGKTKALLDFLVSRVIQSELSTDPIERVEIESVFPKATQMIPWRELQDDGVWRQGWV